MNILKIGVKNTEGVELRYMVAADLICTDK
jgi:hypothetical protein